MTRAPNLCPCVPHENGAPVAVGRGRHLMAYAVAYSGKDQPLLSGVRANLCSQPVTEKLAPYREQILPYPPPRGHFSLRGDGSRQALES
jgi:hypothetical protein